MQNQHMMLSSNETYLKFEGNCHFSMHGKLLIQNNRRNFKELLMKFLSLQNSCN